VLAPVLARLAAVPGVTDARVECSGTFFLVSTATPEALEAALPAVREVLGPSSRRAGADVAEAQLAARPRGEPWFSASGIRGLSYVEGRSLAARMRDAVTARVELAPELRGGLGEAIRVEIFAALDHAHDTGGRSSSAWFWIEWPHVVERISARLAAAFPAALRAEATAVLAAQK
jgi:hypothetical protein